MAEHDDEIMGMFDDDDSDESGRPENGARDSQDDSAARRPDRPQGNSDANADPDNAGRPRSPGDTARPSTSWRDHGNRPASPKPIEGTGDIGRGRGRVQQPGKPNQPTNRGAQVAPRPGTNASEGSQSSTNPATHATPDEAGSSKSSRSPSTSAIREEAARRKKVAQSKSGSSSSGRKASRAAAAGAGFPGAGAHAGEQAKRKLTSSESSSTKPLSSKPLSSRPASQSRQAGQQGSRSAGGTTTSSTKPSVARPTRGPISVEGASLASRRTRERSLVPALIAAIILSFLVHAAVVSAVFNKPIGRIDPTTLSPPHTINLVRRADQDVFSTPAPAEGMGEQQLDERDNPQLDDISRALLEQPIETAMQPREELTQTDIESQLRSVADERAAIDEASAETSDRFDLPGDVISSLLAGPAVNLPETSSNGAAAQAGSGAIAGDGAADLATRMLGQLGGNPARGGIAGGLSSGTNSASGGNLGAGGGLRMPDLPAPQLDQPGATVSDQRLVDARAELPELDLLDTALASTTQLTVPLSLDNDFNYEVHTWWGGNRPDGPPGYFRVDITPKQSLRKLKTIPKDVVIIVDTSGSVSSRWMREIAQGVSDGLASLNEGDRFNIVLFNESPSFLNPDGLETFTPQSIAEAQRFMQGARPRGYTDVNRALSRLLVRDVNAERVHNLILISDGVPTKGVMDTRELINLITRDNNLVASIYCVGVGDKQNRQLLEFLAYRNKGFCQFIDNRAQAAPDLRNLFSRLRFPIVQNISLSLAGVDAEAVYPKHLPNIHQGERLSIFGRFSRAGEFTMRLTGANGAQPVDFTFTRDLVNSKAEGPDLARDWAFWKLHHVYSEILRRGPQDDLLLQVRQIRDLYNLKTLY